MQFIGRYLIKHYTELTRILKSKDSIFTKTVKIVAYVTPSLVAKFYRAITPGWVYSFSNYIGKVYTSIYSRISFISYKASSYAIVQLTTNRLRNSYKLFAKKYASDLIKQKNSHIDKMNMLNSKLRAQITTLRILSGDAGERITNLILNAAQLTLGPNVIKFFLGTGSVRKLFVTPTHTTLQAYASVAMSFLIMGISAFFSKKFMFSDLISYPANLGNIFINSILMLSVIKSAPYIIYKFIKKYASSSVAEMLVNASSSPILLGTSLSNIFFIIANLSVIISAFFMIHNISKEEASIYNQASNAPTFYDLMFTITHDIHHIQMLGVVLMWTLGPQYAVLIAGTSIILPVAYRSIMFFNMICCNFASQSNILQNGASMKSVSVGEIVACAQDSSLRNSYSATRITHIETKTFLAENYTTPALFSLRANGISNQEHILVNIHHYPIAARLYKVPYMILSLPFLIVDFFIIGHELYRRSSVPVMPLKNDTSVTPPNSLPKKESTGGPKHNPHSSHRLKP